MKKILAAALTTAFLAPLAASADIKVQLPPDANLDSLSYDYTTILNMPKPRDERGTIRASAPVKNNVASIPVSDAEGGTQYTFYLGGKKRFTVFAAPGDEIVSAVETIEPLKVKSTGTPLYVGINEIEASVSPILDKYSELSKSENPPKEEMQQLIDEYYQTLKDYIEENPTNPNAVYALMELEGEDFLTYYNKISEGAKTSILFPLAEYQKKGVEKNIEKERRRKELEKGDVQAPEFALLDLEGKTVKLSDFRGKWVILDFWGAWCPWCIKGFPELKEAYKKYEGKLEIIGIDCNEPEKAWREGVKKYELPWVNVYNPKTSTLLEEYGVQGFPTKAIIDPQGNIRNITVGHNPDFFNTLSQLMGE